MIKINLINDKVLVFEDEKGNKTACISKPAIAANGDEIKILFKVGTSVYEYRELYNEFEINGVAYGSVTEALAALYDLCVVFSAVGGGGVTPPTKVITPKTITENGVYDASADGVDGYNPITVDVASSGSDEWQPHPDWWDIKQIFEDDPDPDKRFILLFTDSNNTVQFDFSKIGNTAGGYYKTSDGMYFDGSNVALYEWYKALDKPCSEGYKTRWLMFYSPDPNVICDVANTYNNYVKYAYFGNGSIIQSLVFGSNIAANANKILDSVHIDETVTMIATGIGAYAFYSCFSLRNIVILDGITSIGAYAFYSCFSLRNIVIPESVTSIGAYAFQDCYSLRNIVIPDGITSIGNSTFYSCYSLRNIVIPESVTSIGNGAFQSCNSLRNIVIPDGITSIGNSAILNCVSLLSINIDNGWVPPAFSVAQSTMFSVSGMIEFFNRLGVAPTARTLTFGATNLAKLTPAEKQIATDKGYTLA